MECAVYEGRGQRKEPWGTSTFSRPAKEVQDLKKLEKGVAVLKYGFDFLILFLSINRS